MTETRRFVIGAQLRAKRTGDDSMIIEARAIKYGALSLPGVPTAGARERIAAGCFRSTLANGNDVVALFNHNSNAPLGRTKNGTLKLQDSPDALNFTVRLNPNVQTHRDLHELVKDGTLADCSFAFSDVDDDWTNEKDERGQPYMLRTIRSAKLHDVSIVLAPAYSDGATAVQARALAYQFAEKTLLNEHDAAVRARLERIGAEIRQQELDELDDDYLDDPPDFDDEHRFHEIGDKEYLCVRGAVSHEIVKRCKELLATRK